MSIVTLERVKSAFQTSNRALRGETLAFLFFFKKIETSAFEDFSIFRFSQPLKNSTQPKLDRPPTTETATSATPERPCRDCRGRLARPPLPRRRGAEEEKEEKEKEEEKEEEGVDPAVRRLV